MRSRSIIIKGCLVFVFFIIFVRGETNDFSLGEQAFLEGEHKLAEIYLTHLIIDQPYDVHVPDAVYYLAKIYQSQGNFVDMVSWANRFLDDFIYDERSKEILDMVLLYLNDAKAFSIAFEYISTYDYLIDDRQVIERVGFGLFEQQKISLARQALLLCSQTDSVKIIFTRMTDDPVEKKEIYRTIGGGKGLIYLTEFYLESGDTIAAYKSFEQIDHKELEGYLLYRYAKLCKLFDRDQLPEILETLASIPDYANKARLLHEYSMDVLLIVPQDREELKLLIEHLGYDTVVTSLPDTINLDSIMPDSISDAWFVYLKDTLGNYYYLDSLCCNFLINNKRYKEAYGVIKPYFVYNNTLNFVRKVRSLKNYANREYRAAARDLILANAAHPFYRYVLANSLAELDLDATNIYEELLNATSDSAFNVRVAKELINIYFSGEEFDKIAEFDIDMFSDSTDLIQKYVYSLAHSGEKRTADSLLTEYSLEPGYEYLNHYGEYLIQRKKYKAASIIYDSLMDLSDKSMPDMIYYNWAFIPFIRGQTDNALNRFQSILDDLSDDGTYAKASFKIATIKYLNHEFDSAAFYYEKASKDDDLRLDALQNQMICYKKYGNWSMIIETGRKILPVVSDEEGFDVLFEIGYGYLRSGQVRDAVVYLSKAAKAKPSPEFYYWLAEAHIAKGEFAQGLYYYLRMINDFPRDDMWTPTAEYKSGIAFELMDELEQAKKIYRGIIKRRGAQDTWGIEAQKRLDELE